MIARWLFRRGSKHLMHAPERAERDLLRALAIRPAFPEAWLNLGNALSNQGDVQAARGCFYRAATLAPVSPEPLINASLAEITLGNPDGWRLYEHRFSSPGFIERNGLKGGDRSKMWTGEMLHDKTILVFNEQGAGDTIMGLRYEYALRREYLPERIIFRVPSSLYRLTKASFRHLDWVEVVTDMERTPVYDALVPFLSLPYRCGMESGRKYLEVYAGAPKFQFDPPLNGDLRVGIVWAGSRWHKGDAKRSIPLALWEPLLNVRGVSFVSLQAGERAQDARQFPQLRMIPHPVDFYDTARVMQSLDLVISVDSAPAHLAGALGVPVWTLLPFVPDFRWQLGTETTAWYKSMTLIRQTSRGDWATVIERTRDKLVSLSQQRSAA